MHAYQHQDSQQTLAEGLDEYYRANPGLLRGAQLSPAAQDFFGCHDAAHVVFGCGTSLDDEARVKIASIFGTTEGLGVLRGYQLHESRNIYRSLRAADVLRSIVHSAWVVPLTAALCLRQRSRWPWAGYRQYLSTPLQQLRAHFGIRVAHADRPG